MELSVTEDSCGCIHSLTGGANGNFGQPFGFFKSARGAPSFMPATTMRRPLDRPVLSRLAIGEKEDAALEIGVLPFGV
jgi:hypothetical protein